MFSRESKPKGRFIERFSFHVFYVAAIGSAWVLLDPKFEIHYRGASLVLGSAAFAPEIRGAIITIGILGTIGAIMAAWFPKQERSEPARKTDPPTAEEIK